jgi:hypothetical protein
MPKTSPAPKARPYRCTSEQYTKNLPRKVVYNQKMAAITRILSRRT